MSSMEKVKLLRIIGSNIKRVRESKGLTQVDLVGKIEGEIDTTNISRIESGRTNPTVFTLYRIAVALEVSIKELRLQKSLPIINELGKYMVAQINLTLPKSQIGKAFTYS